MSDKMPPSFGGNTFTSKLADLSLRAKVSAFLGFGILLPFTLFTFFLLNFLGNASIDVGQKTLNETSGLVQQQLLQSVEAKAQIYDLTFKRMIIDLRIIESLFQEHGFHAEDLSRFYYIHPFVSRVYIVEPGRENQSVPAGKGGLSIDVLEGEESLLGKWVGPYDSGGTPMLSYLIPLGEKDNPSGFIAFDITVSSLFNDLVRLNPSESSYLIMIRSSGEYISSSEEINRDWSIGTHDADMRKSSVMNRSDIRNTLLFNEKEKGIIALSATTEKIVTFASIPSYDGKLFVVSPLGELIAVEKEKAQGVQDAVSAIGFQALLFMILIDFALMFLSYYLFGRGVIRPIEVLRAGIEKLKRTNLNAKIDLHSKDEIGQLGRDFNDMAEKLKASYEGLEIEKDKLEESDALMHTMVENLPVGVLLVDAETKLVLLMNRAAAEITGLSVPEVTGKDYGETFNIVTEKGTVYPIPDRPLYGALHDGVTVHKTDMVIVRPSGERRNISSTAAPIRDKEGKIATAVSVFSDITEARIMERSRNEFFAVASHELRTPLTAIRGNADMILDMYADQISDPNLKEMLQDIETSSVRMIAMVNDFLEVSRLEQGKIEVKKESFALPPVIEQVIRNLTEMVHAKGLTLAFTPVDGLPLVCADPGRVEQVLVNLIGNAVKFTKEGGVHITIAFEGASVKVRVTDTGIGISEQNQALLFRKFQQAGEYVLARDVSQSTGLGLYICRLMAQSMGGEVVLEKSELGKGSTFLFVIPLAPATPLS
jgi:two-component system phosphate regulon sensor histidine kinase PhoR